MGAASGRDPDSLEIATARAIVMQAVDEARRRGYFLGRFHGFVVESSSWHARRSGKTARLTRVVVRLDGQLLEQQTLVEGLQQ